MANILVVGATGQTGRLLVAKLHAQQHTLRIVSRNATRARQILDPNGDDELDIHEGDVRTASSLNGAAQDIDVIISTAGTRTYFGKNGGASVDALGMRNLAAEASRCRVSQFILLSAFGLDRRSIFLTAFSLTLNRYFHWKAQAEKAVRQSGVPYTIVRPVELRNRPPKHHTRLNQSEPLSLLRTVSRQTVADVLAHCVKHENALHTTFEVCEGSHPIALDEQLRAMQPDRDRLHPKRTPLWSRR